MARASMCGAAHGVCMVAQRSAWRAQQCAARRVVCVWWRSAVHGACSNVRCCAWYAVQLSYTPQYIASYTLQYNLSYL
jgi:hypothetical protein